MKANIGLKLAPLLFTEKEAMVWDRIRLRFDRGALNKESYATKEQRELSHES
jgi:hypothetical protein